MYMFSAGRSCLRHPRTLYKTCVHVGIIVIIIVITENVQIRHMYMCIGEHMRIHDKIKVNPPPLFLVHNSHQISASRHVTSVSLKQP